MEFLEKNIKPIIGLLIAVVAVVVIIIVIGSVNNKSEDQKKFALLEKANAQYELLISGKNDLSVEAEKRVYEKVIAMFEDLLSEESEVSDLAILTKLSASYYNIGDLEKATDRLALAVRLNPGDADMNLSLANLYRDADKSDSAIFFYQRAININPKLEMAYKNLAMILYMEGRKDDAKEVISSGIEKNPDSEILKGISISLAKEKDEV